MKHEIVLPKCGVSMESGSISKWYKSKGDFVKKDEIIFDLETDKVSVPVESPYQGYVNKILLNEGDEAPVGTVAVILTDEKDEKVEDDSYDASTTKIEVADSDDKYEVKPVDVSVINSEEAMPLAFQQAEPNKDGERVFATPWARKRANDENVGDISAIKGSGPNGVIIGRDIDRYTQSLKHESSKLVSEDAEYIPYKGIRKVIGERLTESKNEKPHYYLRSEVEMTAVLELKERVFADTGVKVSLSEILIYIASNTLEKHPMINAALEGDRIKIPEHVNIGLAVGLDDGLLVPVIKNANNKTLIEVSKEAKELIEKAKSRELTREDLQGGTFTISNLGMYEINEFTAIINRGESAILAVGKIDEKLYFDENRQVQSKKIMNITLSCDHRIIDGVIGAKFLKQLKEYIENPLRILY